VASDTDQSAWGKWYWSECVRQVILIRVLNGLKIN